MTGDFMPAQSVWLKLSNVRSVYTPVRSTGSDWLQPLIFNRLRPQSSNLPLRSASPPLPHTLGVSLPINMTSNRCVYCGKDFVNKYTKKRHLVDQHGEAPQVKPKKYMTEVPIVSSLRCRFCERVFTTRSNRKRHETTVHSTQNTHEPPTVPTAIICKECGEDDALNFTSLGKYREHLEQHHGIPTRKVDHEFPSTQEFMAWKDRLETDLGVNYSKMRGVKKSSTGTRSTYYCRRSGLQRERVQASEAKRAKKSQGSCKLGLYCTSSMEVRRTNDDVIHVSLYTDHRDHDIGCSSLVHTTLTKSERERIADSKCTSLVKPWTCAQASSVANAPIPVPVSSPPRLPCNNTRDLDIPASPSGSEEEILGLPAPSMESDQSSEPGSRSTTPGSGSGSLGMQEMLEVQEEIKDSVLGVKENLDYFTLSLRKTEAVVSTLQKGASED